MKLSLFLMLQTMRGYYLCDAQTNQDKRSSRVRSIGQNYNII